MSAGAALPRRKLFLFYPPSLLVIAAIELRFLFPAIATTAGTVEAPGEKPFLFGSSKQKRLAALNTLNHSVSAHIRHSGIISDTSCLPDGSVSAAG
jgi:hypothetical protein